MFNCWKQPEYIPSLQEIEEKCEEIRRGWSENERRRRMRFYATNSEYAQTRLAHETAEIVEIEPRSRVMQQHPDVLAAGQRRRVRTSSSMLGA